MQLKTDIALEGYILKTLLYYDIFNYPLKSDEVFKFLGTNHIEHEDVQAKLGELVHAKVIYNFGDLFSVQNNEANVLRRIRGNKSAETYLPIALRQAKRIARFPFVRAVMSSGSLSKGYMDENCDIDFFIVTEPGRLWIARTLLVLYKRIFLGNSHKYFCVNYFVDSNHLEIEEKNLFTATELATVIPLYGREYYQQLQENNKWLKEFFPNYKSRSIENVENGKVGRRKKILEKLFDLFGGNVIERFFMQLTLNRWKRMYAKEFPSADFKIAFKTNKHASKNHPRHFQRKVMELYQEKIAAFDYKI